MHYCQVCAERWGWPFAVRTSVRHGCEACGYNYQICDDAPGLELPVPCDDDGAVLDVLLTEARKALAEAYQAHVFAVGEYAAQQARYPAIKAVGWRHKPGIGQKPSEELAGLEKAVGRAEYAWAVRFRAVALLEQMRAAGTRP